MLWKVSFLVSIICTAVIKGFYLHTLTQSAHTLSSRVLTTLSGTAATLAWWIVWPMEVLKTQQQGSTKK